MNNIKHFLLTCKRLLLIFLPGRHAAEMPDRYISNVAFYIPTFLIFLPELIEFDFFDFA